jgi:hypothetical protein
LLAAPATSKDSGQGIGGCRNHCVQYISLFRSICCAVAGSSLERTKNIRATLLDVITRYNITSMLDSSCGSMLWMPTLLQEVEEKQTGFRFFGTDVACGLIDKHKQTFADNKNWGFECVDYANQLLPAGYELVFSRDSLQHLPLHSAWQFLNNVRASGAKWLLVGSYVEAAPTSNVDIPAGEYYSVNLLQQPFCARQPVEVFPENDSEKKHMLLFDVANMTWRDTLEDLL